MTDPDPNPMWKWLYAVALMWAVAHIIFGVFIGIGKLFN